MNIKIVDQPLSIVIYGFSGKALRKDYAGTAFQLMDRMWKTVKSNDLKNKGLNIWVYEHNEKVFAGVELEETPDPNIVLEHKSITLGKYAYFKHIGPYNLLAQVGQAMTDEIKQRGLESELPYVEIYGHWSNDESKLETELLMSLK
jgi:effector-binding domain-containing protein